MGNAYDFGKSRILERIRGIREDNDELRKRVQEVNDSAVSGDKLRITCKVTYIELRGLDPEIWCDGSEEVDFECDSSWTLNDIRMAAISEAWPKIGIELDNGTWELEPAYDAVWFPTLIEFSSTLPAPD